MDFGPRGNDIRQVAALPYRNLGRDAPLQVLLVTSRETRRWVLPKGNRSKALSRHAAAAREAEEEAGVRGAVSSTPLGTYHYAKTQPSGATRPVDVDVFALAVTEELADWPEALERTRRWFTLAEAMVAVDEPDLADLLEGFCATLGR